jgi:hypothetical protein
MQDDNDSSNSSNDASSPTDSSYSVDTSDNTARVAYQPQTDETPPIQVDSLDDMQPQTTSGSQGSEQDAGSPSGSSAGSSDDFTVSSGSESDTDKTAYTPPPAQPSLSISAGDGTGGADSDTPETPEHDLEDTTTTDASFGPSQGEEAEDAAP